MLIEQLSSPASSSRYPQLAVSPVAVEFGELDTVPHAWGMC
ncbi:MAG TPA: hypothetical protein VMB21_06700 [Candidatus Limnocylindria bacterium]|nr:hypothetical protein [Candidatus Limnocylindria bacterium]